MMKLHGPTIHVTLFRILILSCTIAYAQNSYTYHETDSNELLLDIFLPTNQIYDKNPLVIYVHGGGFSGGDRAGGHALAKMLADRGIATASISYTLYMKGKSFGCDGVTGQKIKAIQIASSQLWKATSYLLGRRLEFNLDPQNIFIAGSSAGAETVLHAAHWNREEMNIYEAQLNEDFSYAGVIAGAGAIMDLNLITQENKIPTMLIHGSADPLVPYATASHHFCPPDSPGWLMFFGSYAIHNHLKDLGGTSRLITYCQGGHSYAGYHFYQNQEPVADFISRVITGDQFVEHHISVAEDRVSPDRFDLYFCK